MNKITTSSAAAQLERMYDDLNNAFFEGELLPDVIITLKCTKRAYGHFTTGQVWRVDESTHKHEINISSATLDRPILQTAATLPHEMVHFYCHINNIRDTSNHGVYHNHKYKEAALDHGLLVSYVKHYGWTNTQPSDALRLLAVEKAWPQITLVEDTRNYPACPSSTRKYICPQCGMTCRATKKVNLICGDCKLPLLEV